MTKKFRFMTRLLAAVLAVVMLSSAVYLAVEADHDCSGDDCAICRQISICENLLKSLGLAGAAAAISAAAQSAEASRMPPAILPTPRAHAASHSSSHTIKMIRFFAIAQMWSGRRTCCTTSASTSLAVVSAILALGDRMRRWAHTSAKTAATSSGST